MSPLSELTQITDSHLKTHVVAPAVLKSYIMPTDTRRLPVPESSINPSVYAGETLQKTGKCQTLIQDGSRQDGRKTDQIRPIFLKTGVISQARGSAYIEMGDTKLMCAVYGPREVTKREDFSMSGQLCCELKYATFSCYQRRQHQQDSQDKEYSQLLEEALTPAVCLDKFPKARLDIFVTVLQNNGSVLAGAVSCASVALADAGIEMYDLVVGSSLRLHGEDRLTDPSDQEEYKPQIKSTSKNNGLITVGFMPSLHQVSLLSQHGMIEVEAAVQALRMCITTCEQVFPVLQQCIVKSVQRRLETEQT